MTTTLDHALARRYLLGTANDIERAAIEQDYLERATALEHMAAAEDDLIEDYLDDALTVADREQFEQAYLSSPTHRLRVETVRRLMAHGAASAAVPAQARPQFWNRNAWLAMAASLMLAVSAAWLLVPRAPTPTDVVDTSIPQAAPAMPDQPLAPPAPRVFAVTISPVSVRGAAESPAVVIPPATDILAIRLEAEPDARRLVATRAVIRTVGGESVWSGAAAVDGVSRLDVPASAVPAEDYLVTLFGRDDAGVEREWTRYFLRVRAR